MFDNVGEKIKGMARFVFIAGIVASAIGAIVLWANNNSYTPTVLSGILVLVSGTISSWITAILVYGFGELIESTQDIRRTLKGTEKDSAMSLLTEEARERKTLKDGGWKCTCGRTNESYVSTCACGKNKREVLYPQQNAQARPVSQPAPAPVPARDPEKDKAILADGGWVCSCGQENYKYVSTCGCGKNKREVLAEKQKG